MNDEVKLKMVSHVVSCDVSCGVSCGVSCDVSCGVSCGVSCDATCDVTWMMKWNWKWYHMFVGDALNVQWNHQLNQDDDVAMETWVLPCHHWPICRSCRQNLVWEDYRPGMNMYSMLSDWIKIERMNMYSMLSDWIKIERKKINLQFITGNEKSHSNL